MGRAARASNGYAGTTAIPDASGRTLPGAPSFSCSSVATACGSRRGRPHSSTSESTERSVRGSSCGPTPGLALAVASERAVRETARPWRAPVRRLRRHPLSWGEALRVARAVVLLSLLQGAKCAGEEDERVIDARGTHVVESPYDDPVVAGEMLGDDLTLEGGEGVGDQRCAAAPELPVQVGEPIRAGRSRPPANRSWCQPSTLTPKRPARRMRDQVSELRAAQNDTSGGSSETDVSEFTINPARSPSGVAVTNATPVANLPSASRNERASGAGTGWGRGSERHLNGARALRRGRRGRCSHTRGWRRADA
jgi:hypothetical protein